jgi:hypothetical protein
MLSPPPSPLPPFEKFPGDYFQQQLLAKTAEGRRYSLAILLIPFLLVVLSIPIPRPLSLYNGFTFHHVSSLPQPSSTFSSTSTLSLDFTSSKHPQAKRDSAAFSIPTAPTAPSTAIDIVPTPFPEPFDLSLSWNFTTTSCQNFFLNFTQSDDFRRCRPFSFLLGTSSAFTRVCFSSIYVGTTILIFNRISLG